ncbi:MAG TPA: DUF4185 domain-containing protein [Xanthomonadaceae bacterium]|nr:DUF4185 domain-containing protein [Xanthomonadaceae bacterium]
MAKWLILILSTVSAIACSSLDPTLSGPTGRAFAEADMLFQRDPRWLGADAALSVPLSEGRILWLFGDTFVATSSADVRSESEMVRNTVAIQTGTVPLTASIAFHWRQDSDGSPASFFPERGERWYWPGHGIRIDDGPLVIFLYGTVATPGEGLGFAHAGYAVAVIDNPDAPVETWDPRIVDARPDTFDAVPATALVRDGAYVVALAIRQEGTHAGTLVRYPVTSLAQGDLTTAQWWTGTTRGWVAAALVGDHGPAFVLDDAGAEASVHWDARSRTFIHVASYGFGASTIGLRTAVDLTGPWSSPLVVYRPPESDGPRPLVYAAKAHPELVGPDPGDLVITYATNSFEFDDLFTQHGARSLYWPRFVVVPVDE